MRTLVLLTLLCMTITACARPHIDPAFVHYVVEFQQLLQTGNVAATVTVTVEFGDTMGGCGLAWPAGACCHEGAGLIVVNKNVWDSNRPKARRALIFHELGHCVLHRQHTSEVLGDGAAASLMNPSPIVVSDGAKYAADPAYYDAELIAYAPRKN